jgi:hypothetical protein
MSAPVILTSGDHLGLCYNKKEAYKILKLSMARGAFAVGR